jgi:hypothetical protein
MQDVTLEALRAFLKEYAGHVKPEELGFYAEIGMEPISALQEMLGLLSLDDEPSNGGYFSTPANSLSFARPGVDGIHFSFLLLNNSDERPIVMTTPMNFDETNRIVGSSLHEFLRLGSRFGYSSLEQLTYDYDKTVVAISASFQEKQSDFVEAMISRFDLQPWDNVDQRLKELNAQYLPQLVLPDEEEWLKRNKR